MHGVMQVQCWRCRADMEERHTRFDGGRFYCKAAKACTERLRKAIGEHPERVIAGRRIDRVEVVEDQLGQELHVHLEGGVRVESYVKRLDPDSAELGWMVVPE